MFFVWVTLTEYKWVTLADCRGDEVRFVAKSLLKTGLISGTNSPANARPGPAVQIHLRVPGHIEKTPILDEIMADAEISVDQVAYIGDDLTDLLLMRPYHVGDRDGERPAGSRTGGHSRGGGDRRPWRRAEICGFLLIAQGHWNELLRKYETMLG